MADIVPNLLNEARSSYVIGTDAGSLLIQAADEIERLRAALEPFAEIARRLGWDKIDADDMQLGDHVLDAPAEDIAPGAVYCLMIGAFRQAAITNGQHGRGGE